MLFFQETVAPADPFPQVFDQFQRFVEETVRNGGGRTDSNFVFVTCGNWDLKTMLPAQCSLSGLPVPSYTTSFINIKQGFANFFRRPQPRGMTDMLQELNIRLVGRHHSGIDDARNIAAVLIAMLKQGYVAEATFSTNSGPLRATHPSSRGKPASSSSSSSSSRPQQPQPQQPNPRSTAGPSTTPARTANSGGIVNLGSAEEFPSLSDAKGKGKAKATAPAPAPVQPKFVAPEQQQNKGKSRSTTQSDYDGTVYAMSHLIDVGANLAHKTYDKILPQVLTHAATAGVKNIITLGTSVHSSLRCQSICKTYQGSEVALSFTAGVHPHDAKSCTPDTISQLARMASDPNMVAVGECGLDFDRNFSPQDVQERWFEEQIKLAIQLKKPLYLHERSAHQAFVKILSKVRQ